MKITAYNQHHVGSFPRALVCFVTTNLLVVIEPTSLCNQAKQEFAKQTLVQSKDPCHTAIRWNLTTASTTVEERRFQQPALSELEWAALKCRKSTAASAARTTIRRVGEFHPEVIVRK
jgi:hypothetical protein